MSSLRSQSFDIEYLLQARQPRTLKSPSLNALFQEGSCAGIEECLPSVGASGKATDGGEVPDHGDFWQLPWHIQNHIDNYSLAIQATGFSRPLRFSKQLTLNDNALHIDYKIENLSNQCVSFLYACHPLFAVEAGDRIILPDEVKSLHLHSSHNQRLGTFGDTIAWPQPISSSNSDLSFVLPATARTADMLYTERLQHGWCGLYRAASQTGLVVRFDTSLLPYLGLWLCYGGWPEDDSKQLQYAVAFEPTVAPHGTLLAAQQAKVAPELAPHGQFQWRINFQITSNMLSFTEFQDFCAHLDSANS